MLQSGKSDENLAWIAKAKSLTSRELEREVQMFQAPELRTVRLQISPELLLRLERCQELVCQSEGKPASLEETLESLVKHYLKLRDPVEKAERNFKGQRVTGLVGRVALPQQLKHQIALRDRGQCSHIDQKGKRCPEKKFLQVHHLQPVHRRGANSIENLTTLCAGHHQLLHWTEG